MLILTPDHESLSIPAIQARLRFEDLMSAHSLIRSSAPCPKMDPAENRQVTQAIRAWRVERRASKHYLVKIGIGPVGDPIVIEPFEEIRVLWWTAVNGEAMAVVSFLGTGYLVREEDLEQRTKRALTSQR